MVLRLHNKPVFSSPFTLVAAVDLQMKHGLARALFFQLRRELFEKSCLIITHRNEIEGWVLGKTFQTKRHTLLVYV